MANDTKDFGTPSGAVFLPERTYTVTPDYLDQLRGAGVAPWVIKEIEDQLRREDADLLRVETRR